MLFSHVLFLLRERKAAHDIKRKAMAWVMKKLEAKNIKDHVCDHADAGAIGTALHRWLLYRSKILSNYHFLVRKSIIEMEAMSRWVISWRG